MTSYDVFKIYKLGDEEFKNRTGRTAGTLQDYQALKREYAGIGWKDPDFPHDATSIGKLGDDDANTSANKTDYAIEWHRIKDLVQNEYFMADEEISYPGDNTATFSCSCAEDSKKFSRFDIKQGGLGDCYFVAGLAAITQNRRALEQVVPFDNNDDKDSGVYHFRFWYLGCWVEVVVDDYLPFKKISFDNPEDQPYYVTVGASLQMSGNNIEYWVGLAEKAYAKLAGNFGAISEGGQPMDSLQNLTGGLCERYYEPYQDYPYNFFEILKSALDKVGLVALTCAPPEEKEAAYTKIGLCFPHAYTVTKFVELKTKDGHKVKLVRIRNPHGTNEWKGPWWDKSPQWDTISDKDKAKIKLTDKDDGEFYMEYSHVIKYFLQMDVVSFLWPEMIVPPTVVEEFDGDYGSGEDDYYIRAAARPGESFGVVFAEVTVKSPIWEDVDGIRVDLDMYPAEGGEALVQDEGTKITGDSGGHSICLAYKVEPGQYRIEVRVDGPIREYAIRLYYTQDEQD